MNDDYRDPILDACLEEMLGEVRPPDLTDRILKAWSSHQANDQRQSQDAPTTDCDIPVPIAGSAPILSEPIPPPIQVLSGGGPATVLQPPDWRPDAPAPSTPGKPAASSRLKQHRRKSWNSLAIALSVVAVATACSVWVAWTQLRQPDSAPGIVQQGSARQDLVQQGTARQDDGTTENDLRSGNALATAKGPTDDAGAQVAEHASNEPREPSRPFPDRVPFARNDAGSPSTPDPTSPADGTSASDSVVVSPWPDADVVAFVNAEVRESWQDYGVAPAPTASDENWCRRAFLRLLGRIPTVAELRRFLDDPAVDRRSRLVDRMLDDSEYESQWADHWSGVLTNVMLGRTGGAKENKPGDRVALQGYLRDQLLKDRPFDELAFDLISATGSTDPKDGDFNPAVHFVLASMNEKATLVTSRTSRSFLGKQLQCTQCHHHPSNEWAQRQFWELNSFFRQMHIEKGGAAGHYRVVNRDFRGESGRDPTEAEIYFERLNGRLQAAYPAFLGKKAVSTSGLVSDVDRRRELANFVAKSNDLNRSAVNRLWNHFLGHAFTRTVDDMGPHSTPSHPELLEALAAQFAAHNHDLKSLMRWITKSEAFGLSSRELPNSLADRPDAGSVPLFSRYYTRQLPPEEVFQSLKLVASARRKAPSAANLAAANVAASGVAASDLAAADVAASPGVESPIQARKDWLGQFSRDMGTDEGNEISSFQGDIRQSLIIMNGPLMRQATNPRDGAVLTQVLESKLSADEKVEHLFLAALARKPTKRESALIGRMLQRSGNEREALQDVWWALLNSNEFILDH